MKLFRQLLAHKKNVFYIESSLLSSEYSQCLFIDSDKGQILNLWVQQDFLLHTIHIDSNAQCKALEIVFCGYKCFTKK